MTFWVAGAVVVGSAISAYSASSAAGQQAGAQEQAANTQQGMFNTITGQEQPFLKGGYGAETALNKLLGTSPGSFDGMPNGYLTEQFNPTMQQLESYPGYQFQLQQGGQAIRNADTPGVGALSGPALKDLMSFNQGLAASNYQNYFNQFQTQQNNIFNRLNSIAQLGQNAAGNLGSAGTQLGTGIAQAQAAAGGSLAAGTVGVGNSIAGGAVPLAYLLSGQNATSVNPTAGAAGGNGGFGYVS